MSAMDTACVSGEVEDWQEAVADHEDEAWEENTGQNEHSLAGALVAGSGQEPVALQDSCQLCSGDQIPLLSPVAVAESDEFEDRGESERVGEADGAGGQLQVAAGNGRHLVWGELCSGEEDDEGDFLDPDYDPESDAENEIVADIGLAQNVVIRLATQAENDSDDDSPRETPHNLVSGLLGRIGLRAMLRGGMHRAPRCDATHRHIPPHTGRTTLPAHLHQYRLTCERLPSRAAMFRVVSWPLSPRSLM